jgi:hypothetical protein
MSPPNGIVIKSYSVPSLDCFFVRFDKASTIFSFRRLARDICAAFRLWGWKTFSFFFPSFALTDLVALTVLFVAFVGAMTLGKQCVGEESERNYWHVIAPWLLPAPAPIQAALRHGG